MLLESYQRWFEALAEYENLTKVNNPEWVKYREMVATNAKLTPKEHKLYVNQFRLTPKIVAKINASNFKAIESQIQPLELKINQIKSFGVILEEVFIQQLKAFNWKDVVVDSENFVTFIDLSKNKIDKVSRVRKLIKKCQSLGIKITKHITDNQCLIYANVQEAYAPILKHLNLE